MEKGTERKAQFGLDDTRDWIKMENRNTSICKNWQDVVGTKEKTGKRERQLMR